ncbi:hypothetical protein NDU88_005950 [Pleurodeles waltl]|uniref:Uncharacterized protein n=1 Tax=Pleurodeles waltl TaxID=8319 RepID=A0AAV7N1M0_PLEWA|nr:hypothetical protein NDU88_005950 [Pleurodeles waltl]
MHGRLRIRTGAGEEPGWTACLHRAECRCAEPAGRRHWSKPDGSKVAIRELDGNQLRLVLWAACPDRPTRWGRHCIIEKSTLPWAARPRNRKLPKTSVQTGLQGDKWPEATTEGRWSGESTYETQIAGNGVPETQQEGRLS